MKEFYEIDHTADLALQVNGKSVEELFLNALKGMYYLIFRSQLDIKKLRETESEGNVKPIMMSAPTLEDLLVLWLSDMVYKIEVYNKVVTGYTGLQILETKESSQLEGRLLYKNISEMGLEMENEIKAVTYHQLDIRKNGNDWSTKITFDV